MVNSFLDKYKKRSITEKMAYYTNNEGRPYNNFDSLRKNLNKRGLRNNLKKVKSQNIA